MEYIISLDFNVGRSYYIRDNQNGTWYEIYTPYEATTFTSRKKAKDWVKTNTTLEEYSKICKKADEIVKFDEWAKNGFVRRSFDVVDNNLSRPYNNESPDEVLAWRIAYSMSSEDVRYRDYKTWPDLYSIFKCLNSINLYGDNKGKDLLSFSMAVRKDTEFSVFCEELNKIVDKVTFLDEDGDKVIDIFDHKLGYGGDTVSFVIHKNGKYSIKSTWIYQVERVSLERAFEYWKAYRYYE